MELKDYDWSREPLVEQAAHEVIFIPGSLMEMTFTAEPVDDDDAPDIDHAFVRADKLRETYELLEDVALELELEPGQAAAEEPTLRRRALEILRSAGRIK